MSDTKVLGCLGSGQLGRMVAIAAKKLGATVHFFSPEAGSPGEQITGLATVAAYDDFGALSQFASQVSAVVCEFENVPSQALELLASRVRVFPAPRVLHICQHRLREKTFLSESGFPVVPFATVDDLAGLRRAVNSIGFPSVLKTAGFGYDGKGQRKLGPADDLASALSNTPPPCVLEQFLDFQLELSVIVARDTTGDIRTWGPIENVHRNHILDTSICPARISAETARAATDLAMRVARHIDVVGLLCVEMFLERNGTIRVNELAPRPHNSGHLTIEASRTSQFEQLARIALGMPMGPTEMTSPSVMLNLLGDLWQNTSPDWSVVDTKKNCHLHLYGKAIPKPGRKMGHLTAIAPTVDEAYTQASTLRKNIFG